jgi:SAM-dependent methyltransferase
MMKRLAETGTVFGVDADHGALAHCKSAGFDRLCRGDATRLPFGPAKFALVIASDMIEHCDDDSAALDELFRVTRPGGRLLISVPAYNALWSSHDVALHHKRRYTRSELALRVRAAGFEIERASYFNTLLFPPAALVRLTLRKFGRGKPQGPIKYHGTLKPVNQALLGLLRLEKLWLNRFNFPFGLSILLLASKK